MSNTDRAELLKEVSFLAKSESFFRRWERELKGKEVWPFPILFHCCNTTSLNSRPDISENYCRIEEADLLIIGGTITQKMIPYLKNCYDSMGDKKWVMAIGACASSGGPYWTHSVVQGASQIIPVDVYVPGCPPSFTEVERGLEEIRYRIENNISARSQITWSLNV